MRIIVGITGASGSPYAVSLLKEMKSLGIETDLVISRMGGYVMKQECGISSEEAAALCSEYHGIYDLGASIASGSSSCDGMVIVPCSMKTLSAVASGYSDSLLTRAADVTIKERRPLIMVVRETPLSAIHIENMLKLSRLGVIMLPACPAFYTNPQTIGDMTDFMTGKILDELGIRNEKYRHWTGMELD